MYGQTRTLGAYKHYGTLVWQVSSDRSASILPMFDSSWLVREGSMDLNQFESVISE